MGVNVLFCGALWFEVKLMVFRRRRREKEGQSRARLRKERLYEVLVLYIVL